MEYAGLQVTTNQVLAVTLVVILVDMFLILSVVRWIHPGTFRSLTLPLFISSLIFFALVWTSVLTWAWDWFYIYIFPAWFRPFGPLMGLAYGFIGLAMAWVSRRMARNPAVLFCLLGGLEGLLTHLFAIYILGAVSKPPIMQAVMPEAVLVFAIFEKMLYWSLILLVTAAFYRLITVKKAIRPGNQID